MLRQAFGRGRLQLGVTRTPGLAFRTLSIGPAWKAPEPVRSALPTPWVPQLSFVRRESTTGGHMAAAIPKAAVPGVTLTIRAKKSTDPGEQKLRSSAAQGATDDSMSLRAVMRALVGNSVITLAKFGAYFYSGSAAMLSEAIHTLVDTANQILLYFGIKQARKKPDGLHHYGYGRSAFFYALLSGMGMFWVGSGAVLIHAIESLCHLPTEPVQYGGLTWGVLGGSFLIDGAVLVGALKDLNASKKPHESLYQHLKTIRDPMILAVIYEDLAACTGVVMAIGGVGLSYMTGMAVWDPMASIGVGALLGGVALSLVKMNKRFLLGQAIDKEMESDIKDLLLSRPAVEAVHAVSNTWEGPNAFTYKADVDFDGHYLAKQLEPLYFHRFRQETSDDDLRLLLNNYSEDLTRLIEKEVFKLQEEIKGNYDEAKFIEIQPHSTMSKAFVGEAHRQAPVE